jgi:replicative DNA helicase
MEERWSNSMEYTHILEATEEALEYIDNRRQGLERSLETRWDKFNKVTMSGIDWNTIMTIGGMSGSGKSAIANELETSLFDRNPDEKFAVLSFNFEMLAMKQVGRKISSKLDKSVSELYSSEDKLSDTDYKLVKDKATHIAENYDIYYVDTPGSVEQVYDTVMSFYEKQSAIHGEDFGVVVFLDHTLLTKGRQRESERELLARLYKMFMFVKKKIKCIFVVLSQLNREIESADRLSNPMLHYPMKKDIFGSDAVFHGSDYVMISHKPYMLNMQTYGPNNLPIVNPLNSQQPMIYWHLIKNRDGEAGVVLSMVDNLQFSRVDEHYEPGKIQFSIQ